MFDIGVLLKRKYVLVLFMPLLLQGMDHRIEQPDNEPEEREEPTTECIKRRLTQSMLGAWYNNFGDNGQVPPGESMIRYWLCPLPY